MTRPRSLSLLPLMVVLVGVWVPSRAGAAGGVDPALAWLRGAQLADGGFSSGFSEGSDLGATADAVIAIAAAGETPSSWSVGPSDPLGFLAAHRAEATGAGLAAKVALALIAAGQDPVAFAGGDLTRVIEADFNPSTGFFGAGPYDSALAILALAQSGQAIPDEAIQGLLKARQADGSFAFDGSMTNGSGDSNTTALAVQALLIAGAGQEVAPSYAYFRERQNADGGWTYQKPSAYGEATDANSTALVAQALMAGGQDLRQWGDPLAALLALQQPSGALAFNADTPGDNALATIQAIPAMAGVDLTDLARLGKEPQAPDGGARAVLFAAGFILLAVLVVSAVVGRTERS